LLVRVTHLFKDTPQALAVVAGVGQVGEGLKEVGLAIWGLFELTLNSVDPMYHLNVGFGLAASATQSIFFAPASSYWDETQRVRAVFLDLFMSHCTMQGHFSI